MANSRIALWLPRGQCEDSVNVNGSIVEPEGTGLLLVLLVALLPGADKAFDVDMRAIAAQGVPPLGRPREDVEAPRLHGGGLGKRVSRGEFAGQAHELEA